jgi:hypothetical protein
LGDTSTPAGYILASPLKYWIPLQCCKMKVFSFPLLACNAVKAQYTLPDLETLKQFMYLFNFKADFFFQRVPGG